MSVKDRNAKIVVSNYIPLIIGILVSVLGFVFTDFFWSNTDIFDRITTRLLNQEHSWAGQAIGTSSNCDATLLSGLTLDQYGGVAGDIWLHYWSDGWEGAWTESGWVVSEMGMPSTDFQSNWQALIDVVPREGDWHICVVPRLGSWSCISNVVEARTSSDCETGNQVIEVLFQRR